MRFPTVTLRDTKPEVFETYLHWVYSNEVDIGLLPEPPVPQDTYAEVIYHKLAELWVFGDMMLDLKVCNRIIDMTLELWPESHERASISTIQYIYANTGSGSKLRTIHRDFIFTNSGEDFLRENDNELPRDLLLELAMAYLDGEPDKETCIIDYDGNVKGGKFERYHTHENSNVCAKAGRKGEERIWDMYAFLP